MGGSLKADQEETCVKGINTDRVDFRLRRLTAPPPGPSPRLTGAQPSDLPFLLGLQAFLLICSFLCLETSVLSTPVLPVSRTVSSRNSHSEATCGHRNREQKMREPRSVASLVFSTLVHPGGREDPPGQHQTCFLPSCWIGLATILQAAFWQVHKAKSFKGRDGLCVLSLFFSYWFLCALPNPINKRPEERDARLAYKSLGLRLSFLFSIY